MEGARIYAENAIRDKNQALNYLRLAGRVDAVAARVETAVRMQQITKSMSNVVEGMDQGAWWQCAAPVALSHSPRQRSRSVQGAVHVCMCMWLMREGQSMNLEQISMLMDRFDKTFESLDVQSMTMEQSMQSSSSMSTPVDQVDRCGPGGGLMPLLNATHSLIAQVAQEHGLEVGEQLNGVSVPASSAPATAEQDDLTARLERLKANQ